MINYISSSIHNYLAWWLPMSPILIVLIVGCIMQLLKVITDSIKYKRFFRWNILSSWWFPSFHSWLASSVTTLVLLKSGFGSIEFAVAFAFAVLFAYDAMNLRYEAWLHAHYINDLRYELQDVLIKKEHSILKERIWHLPLEVLWWIILWTLLTFIFYYLFFLK